MKKGLFTFNLFIYYILGFSLFTTISYITYITATAILMQAVILPLQGISQIPNYLMNNLLLYFIIYTILFLIILYFNYKYDTYIVNKLNEKLQETRGGDISEEN